MQEQEFVEFDPTGRYGRYNEVLGKGSSKIVYRAFDEYEGIEVAWNQVKLHDFLQCPDDLERLYCEIHLLKTLKHKNIMKFYSSWVDISKRNINFVTEMFTSGTLRQFRQKHRKVHIRAVKNWCRQILDGLDYLHSHDPPIIHRDLKCDNILINGNQGEVKIGDLGLAAILRQSHAVHCVGTPEFMAPEVYKEEYNELVDIYSFGMCVLEMITFEYPYSECNHPAQIYKKVSSGTMPEALYEVKDIKVRQFVEKCLAPVSNRLSAKALLMDPFLLYSDSDESDFIDLGLFSIQPSCSSYNSSSYLDASESLYNSQRESEMDFFGMENNYDFENNDSCINLFNKDDNSIDDDDEKEHVDDLDITIKGKIGPDGGIFIRLRIGHIAGHPRNIHFLFNTDTDTALGVAAEMVDELDITEYEVTKIAELIDNEVSSLVPKWKTPVCLDDDMSSHHNYESNVSSSYDSHLDYIAINEGTMHGRFEEIAYQGMVTPQSSFGESQISDKKSEDDDKKSNKDMTWLKKMYNTKVKDWKSRLLRRRRRQLNLSLDLDNDPLVCQKVKDSKNYNRIQSFHVGKRYSYYPPNFDDE